jgi:hypothetical protein
MFVSEIIPNLWVCDYDVITSNYFNNRNIGLYIHVYTFEQNFNMRLGFNQELIEIKIKEINSDTRDSQSDLIERQVIRYSKDFAESIHHNIGTIHNTLKYKRGVVIYSKHAIQKAATMAAAYLILKGNVNAQSAIHIMKSKEPLFFKDIENLDDSGRNGVYILYEHVLNYIERLV